MMQSEIDRQMALVRTVSEKVHSLTANLDGTDVKKSYTLGFAPMGVNFGEVLIKEIIRV